MAVQLVDVVGVLATMTVFIMELGPAPAVREIVKNRSTGLTPLVPLVALGTNGWIWCAIWPHSRSHYRVSS
jgi:hypothetical protein